MFGAAASTLAYNYFFTAPIHTFRISRPDDLVTVIVLFLVAVVTSQLASRMRRQARIAAANAARNATIAGLARRLLSSSTPAEIGAVACGEIASLFSCNAVLLSGGSEDPNVVSREPAGTPLTPSDLAAAAYALEYGEPAGRGAGHVDPAEWLFYPVKSETKAIAALGLARDDGLPPVPTEQLPLLTNLLDQVALALERSALEAEVRDLDRFRERDRLREALLSSVGHDLRTPLTGIAAAAAELRSSVGPGGREVLQRLITETDKLARYIANLLGMARLEAGAVRLNMEPTDLVDAVAAAARDLGQVLAGRPLRVDLPEHLPLVRADPQLLHHILINLLDNAARHSPAGAPVSLAGSRDGDEVVLSIADEGPGLPTSDRLQAFERMTGSDRRGGTGLGLAIVGGFAAAMGLRIAGENRRPEPGAVFTLTFPGRLIIEAESEPDAASA